MKCWKCGKENSDYVTFCESCGSILNQGSSQPQAEPSMQAASVTTDSFSQNGPGSSVNEDLELLDEFEVVSELVQKTQVGDVMRASTGSMEANRFVSKELLQILQKEGDEKKTYLLNNGPTGNMPGVYLLNEDGEIHPYPLHVPMEFNGRSLQASKKPLIL